MKFLSKKIFLKFLILISIPTIICTSIYIKYKINSTINFYVSPFGSDSNDGDKYHPFKTLEAARDAVRKILEENNNHKDINIFIRGGNYFITKSFNLEKIDSPNGNFSISYKAYKNEKVYFIGGYDLSSDDFNPLTNKTILNILINKEHSKNILVADLSYYLNDFSIDKENILNAPELFFNDTPMTLARYPNEGFLTTGKVINSQSNDTIYSFKYNEINPSLWNESKNIWMNGYWYHNWSDSTVKVSNIDISNKLINISDKLPYGLRENQRYYYFNILEELDTEGEYYIDYDKKLLYFLPSSPIENSKIQLSSLNQPFITMKEVSNTTIEGINFENTRASSEIIVENGSNNMIKNCVIRNTSQFGIYIKGGTNNGIENCEIYNTGTGGIVVNGGDRNTLTPCNNYVHNNEIYNYARLKKTYSAAIHISGVGIKVSNNSIHDAPHTAILFTGNDHIIEYNELYNVAKETDDVGVIYVGRDWTYRGNIIRYNYLHDINNNIGNLNVSGIYLDDCMSGTKVYGNVFHRVKNPIFIGGGRDNIVKNNMIIDCPNSIHFDERGLTWNLDQLYTNLKSVPYESTLWTEKYPELKYLFRNSNPGIPENNIIENNVLYKTSAPVISKSVIQYGTVENNKLYEDNPGFINSDKLNFNLNKNSVIFKDMKDFESIPFDSIGKHP